MSAIDISAIAEGDLRRFAACWLNSELNTDWDAAHKTFDPEGKLKLASFKTVTQKASKKAGGGGAAAAANGENGDAAKPKKAAPKRKKAASEANNDNEGESKPKKARAPAKKSKKDIAEEKVVEDDEAPVKGEDGDEEDVATWIAYSESFVDAGSHLRGNVFLPVLDWRVIPHGRFDLLERGMIHDGNILWHEEESKCYIIDYERAALTAWEDSCFADWVCAQAPP
ncbi:hypothetical protein CERZMDRAFT_92138 [Cercospora zeae-maydis SCOH1-5]|uniref:Uncharacterized protein n=1 Tax=Cercospora zeae-maydis SCOH1-5 TaxID=717836 RepID=A0A6A6FVN9_9PEZI|nr:hypothetical protein CERZMDRAFT_92138 [Cercospora zeae-maydis SCOH1-5]